MPIKKIVFFFILIASFFVINGLIHSIHGMLQKEQLVLSAKQELDIEKKNNQALKKQLAVVKRPQFLEEEARNKLFLVKSGENVVIIPTISPTTNQIMANKQQIKPHWQEWWELFF